MENKSASFILRLLAFFIDVIIVVSISSLLSSPFIDYNSINNLSKSNDQVINDFINNKINVKTYLSESTSIMYENSKLNGIRVFITIFIQMIYFIVFQIHNKGQTIGKKLFKIKIISSDSNEITYNQIILHTFLIDMIFLNFSKFILLTFVSKNVYFYLSLGLELLQCLFIIITIFMIFLNKKKIGLHDLISHTRVVSID